MTNQFEAGSVIFKCFVDEGFHGLNGRVGFFYVQSSQFDPATFAEGFAKMESWIQAQKVDLVLGPFMGNTLYPYRLRTSHFQETPFWGEPDNGEDIVLWLKQRGYTENVTYVSSRIRNQPEVQSKMKKFGENLPTSMTEDLKAVSFSKALWSERKKELFELTLESFKGNYLFKPYSFEQFDRIYDPLIQQTTMMSDSSVLLMAEDKVIGFCFNFEDPQNIYIKTMGVHPQFRRLGTSFLFLLAASYSRILPGKDLVLCLMKEGNVPDVFSASSVVEKRTYALFQKSL